MINKGIFSIVAVSVRSRYDWMFSTKLVYVITDAAVIANGSLVSSHAFIIGYANDLVPALSIYAGAELEFLYGHD